jgi:hypothetical protein
MQPAVLFARHSVGLHGLLPAFAQAGMACCTSRDCCKQWVCTALQRLSCRQSREVDRQAIKMRNDCAGSRALSTASKSAVRVEKDTMGSLEVPADRWAQLASLWAPAHVWHGIIATHASRG